MKTAVKLNLTQVLFKLNSRFCVDIAVDPRKHQHCPLLILCLLAGFAWSQGYAQSNLSALGKPGEPARIRMAITPSMVGSWTGLVAFEKKYWERYLPRGSHVDLDFALRGAVVATALSEGRVQLGYLDDLRAVALVASDEGYSLVGVAALSQDLCVLVVRYNAPAFTNALEGIRWLAGKRFAVRSGTCDERVAHSAFARENVQPAHTFDFGSEVFATAFKNGSIDAAGVNEVGAANLIEAGLARRLYSSRTVGAWDAVFIAASAALINQCSDLLRGWLQAELDAQVFISDVDNTDETVGIVAKHLPGVPERALRLALYGAYPTGQGGAPVRRVFPFHFSETAIEVVRDAHHIAQQLELTKSGDLPHTAIQGEYVQELLRARGLKAPLGEVRARTSFAPK